MYKTANARPDILFQSHTNDDGTVIFEFKDSLTADTVGDLWKRISKQLETVPSCIVIEAKDIDYCDSSGLSLLFQLQLYARQKGLPIETRGLKDEFVKRLDRFNVEKFMDLRIDQSKKTSIVDEAGKITVAIYRDLYEQIVFLGRLCSTLAGALAHPVRMRWKDISVIAEHTGANAVGIVVLLGFLFGLIIAFSAAMPLRQFGTEIYVADLVAFVFVRVFGPFVTAVILAGRTSSAFAAELGTMKINDEINALTTMGIDPVRFLVVPRVIATVIVMPLLVILSNLAGLVGSAIVVLSLGFPLVTYTNHVQSAIDVGDVAAGLVKCFVFGWLVAQAGCLRGMQTRTGPSAVGISTTRAVVTGIILIVIAEGIFAVLYYFLDI